MRVVFSSPHPFLRYTCGTISPYCSNSFTLGDNRYLVWVEMLSGRFISILLYWNPVMAETVLSAASRREGLDSIWVPSAWDVWDRCFFPFPSVSVHHFSFLVFILRPLLRFGDARLPSDEVMWCRISGRIRRAVQHILGIRLDLFLESCTQAKNSD